MHDRCFSSICTSFKTEWPPCETKNKEDTLFICDSVLIPDMESFGNSDGHIVCQSDESQILITMIKRGTKL